MSSPVDVPKDALDRMLGLSDRDPGCADARALYDAFGVATRGTLDFDVARALAVGAEALVERDRLRALISNPHTDDFLEAARIEAAHQRERWGTSHDAGKTAPDWFWLIGYLAGKALEAWKRDDSEKLKHHVITTAAACLNWHASVSGVDTSMRPGIEPPETRGGHG